MPYLKQALERKHKELTELISRTEKRLHFQIRGNLKVTTEKNGRVSYQYRRNDEEKYIYISAKQRNILRDLTQRDYDKKLLRKAKEEIKAIDRLLNRYDPNTLVDVYANSGEGRQAFIKDAVWTDEEYARRWKNAPYKRNTRKYEKKVITEAGEVVRSKSEQDIADLLYKSGIAYRVEEKIQLDDGSYVCPDFSILNARTKEVYYLEHMGKMTDPEYLDNAIDKLMRYHAHGKQFIGHLLFTFEDSKAQFTGKEIIPIYIRDYFT